MHQSDGALHQVQAQPQLRLVACQQRTVGPVDQQPGDIGWGFRRLDTGERGLQVAAGRGVITHLSFNLADQREEIYMLDRRDGSLGQPALRR